MAESKRRLAAILSADVAGYSRLMGDDEEATIAALDIRRQIFRDRIAARAGRVVDTAGDSVLAVFESVVEAVRCAAEVQKALAESNSDLPEDRRMRFRIGVNLGDIVEKDDGTIYGDGVNIAARLEALAEPGGIAVSQDAHRQVEGKTDLGFADIGEHEVKNIARPVRAYQVLTDGAPQAAPRARQTRRPALIAAAAAVVVIIAGVAVWQTTKPPETVAEPENSLLASPARPVIAVLPFDNMSGDPEQEYFSDGITEDIITGLSLFPDILVIARNSTFQYKGKAVDVRRVGKELGATYVVEGSVRRSGDRIRVTAQLLDASDGSHLWAETYDRDLSASDIFDLQDEIRGRVVATIADYQGVLIQPYSEAATTKRTESLDAYECVLRAMAFWQDLLPDSHKESRACLERAVEIDPEYAEAWAWLAMVYMGEHQWGYNARPDPLDRSLAAAKRAVELNPRSQMAHYGMAQTHFFRHELDQFYEEAEKTVSLNPNNAAPLGAFANFMSFAGNWERSSQLTEMAIALNPVHPSWYFFGPFYPHYLQGNYEAALEDAQKINMPGFFWYHIAHAVALAQNGRLAEAASEVEDLLKAYPGFTLQTLRDELRIWNFRDEHIEPLVDGLRMAGIEAPGDTPAED